MSRKLIVPFLLISILHLNCKKDSNAKIDVSAITETDNVGNTLSQIDNTDWIIDNMWTTDELALFQTPGSSQLTNMEKAIVSIEPSFPNPSAGGFYFAANISKSTLVQIVITDNMLSVKDRFFATNKNINFYLLKLNLDASKYPNNTNYRMYYGFYSMADGLYYKGHGDLKINR